ncbi:MAG: GAF domain-containing protein [Planctomycetales bacterium]|nr:GAF domain-containing protein [Planctomycetales bacterium]
MAGRSRGGGRGRGPAEDALRGLGRVLGSTLARLPPKELFRAVVDGIHAEYPGLYHVSVFLAFEGSGVFMPGAMAGEDAAIYAQRYPGGYTQALSVGLLGAAYKSRRTVLVNDVTRDPRYHPAVEPVTRSELCIPILAGRDVVGILNLESRKREAFGPADVNVFERVAGTLSHAVLRALGGRPA